MIEHLKKIDFVLNFFKSKQDLDASFSYTIIENHVKRTSELKITVTMLREILKKLVNDGYITERKQEEGYQSIYHVSFEGLVFEGYVHENEANHKEQERLHTLENRQLALSRRMNALTAIVAVGTIVAAVYYLMEILKSFCPSS